MNAAWFPLFRYQASSGGGGPLAGCSLPGCAIEALLNRSSRRLAGGSAGGRVKLRSIVVLRLGQRYVRDDRTLTHLCLVSRALGAESIYLEDAEKDVTATLDGVNKTWGGEFKALLGVPWRRVIQDAKKEGRSVVHLTMYGTPIQDAAPRLRSLDKILIVVGGPKVPGRVYHEADFNVAVTSQPHSEVAALAIALHEIQSGEELKRTFQKSRLRILPSARGKRVVEN